MEHPGRRRRRGVATWLNCSWRSSGTRFPECTVIKKDVARRSDAVVRRKIAGKRPALVSVVVLSTIELILLLRRSGVPRSPSVSRDSRAAVPRFQASADGFSKRRARAYARHFPYGFLISLFLGANERGRTRGYRREGRRATTTRVVRAREGLTPSGTIFESALCVPLAYSRARAREWYTRPIYSAAKSSHRSLEQRPLVCRQGTSATSWLSPSLSSR